MYSIRVDAPRRLVSIELSARVATEEALRAVSQLFTLAETGNIRSILCDVTDVRRGPGGLLLVSSALAVRFGPRMRMAVVGRGIQRRMAQRLVRFAGIRTGVEVFESRADAEHWLGAQRRREQGVAGTELRHAKDLMGAGRATRQNAAGSATQPTQAPGSVPAA